MTLALLSTRGRFSGGVSAFFLASNVSVAPKAEEIGHDRAHPCYSNGGVVCFVPPNTGG